MSAKDNWKVKAKCPYFGTKTKQRIRCQDPLSETEGEAIMEVTDSPVLESIFEHTCCDKYDQCPIYMAMTLIGKYDS